MIDLYLLVELLNNTFCLLAVNFEDVHQLVHLFSFPASQLMIFIFLKKYWRDGMGREVGGGFMMGDTCTPMADSCQCMAKTTAMSESN